MVAQATEKVTAYCVKCKQKREMNSPETFKMKNGKKAYRGTCVNCSTKMVKIAAAGAK